MRSEVVPWLLAVAATVLVGDSGVAQPFGFLLGPPQGLRAHRATRRRPKPIAEVPLPVPRPSFPEDKAASTAANESSPGAAVVPPLPPPRPPSLAERQTARAATASPASSNTGEPHDAGAAKQEALGPDKGAVADAPATAPAAKTIGASKPAIAASGAATSSPPRSPAEDPLCPDRLKARHVAAVSIEIGAQPDPRCTVVDAVRLTGLVLDDGGKVDFPDKPSVACTTADAFSRYVRDLLVPLAKGTFGSPVAAVWTGPGLECRSRDHIFGAKLSAHGQGLAIDIAKVKLADGRIVAVGEPKTKQETEFEAASRAGGCGYFHTVLGPGSDSYHRTHWHFDLEVRGSQGDGKYCK